MRSGAQGAECFYYLLSKSEGTAKLLSITVARPHLHSCVNYLRNKQKRQKKVAQKHHNIDKSYWRTTIINTHPWKTQIKGGLKK